MDAIFGISTPDSYKTTIKLEKMYYFLILKTHTIETQCIIFSQILKLGFGTGIGYNPG